MKKLLLVATISIAGLMSANSVNGKEVSLLKFLRTLVYQWTSTCGVKHTTSFTGDWSANDIATWIAFKNEDECGNFPSKVTVDIAPN